MTKYAVLNLIEASSSDETKIEELLRRTKAIAFRLNLPKMVSWCNSELKGYNETETPPKYRLIENIPVFSQHLYYNSESRLDLSSLNTKNIQAYKLITTIYLGNSITEIKSYSQKDFLYLCLTSNQEKIVRQITINQKALSFHHALPGAAFSSIISRVRDHIQDWALELEKNDILGEGLLFSLIEKEKAMNNTIINNNNTFNAPVRNNGIISAGNSGNIQQNNAFNEEKWERLKNALEKLTVPANDIQTLRNELQNISAPQTEDDIPKNIWKWLGRIGANVLEVSLYSALSSYFGFQISP